MEIVLKGTGVSPGIAIGPALPFGVQSVEVPKYRIECPKAELERFKRAIDGVREELQALYDRTAETLGPQHANIFTAYMLLLDDVTLRDDVESRVASEQLNVEFLVDDMVKRYSAVLKSVDDARIRERTEDLVDVGSRILNKLLNTEVASLEHLERPSMIVAHNLSPSDTAKLDLEHTLGMALETGGATSHTAILAHAFAIPTVVGLKYVGAHVLPGDTIIIDGTEGQVVIRPDEATLERYLADKKREEKRRRALLAAKGKHSTTLDGHEIQLLANIELSLETGLAKEAKAQGIGLYRTEFLFMNRATLPTEQEQFETYSQVAQAMGHAPVTIRTLDVGGDKVVPRIQSDEEKNPQLGWRAIRFCLDRPDIFKAQLRAILRASVHGNIRLMFPLISGLDILRDAKNVLREVCADLEARSVPFDKKIEVGIMIEVPAAVEMAAALAEESDFFSIGTNDLIQYSLAVDRENERVAPMFLATHPAVLRMVRRTVKAAKAANIPCALCGEMAGNPVYTELLLGLELDELSMSPVSIPEVRAEVCNIRASAARRHANRVMKLHSAAEIEDIIQERYRQRATIEGLVKTDHSPRKSAKPSREKTAKQR